MLVLGLILLIVGIVLLLAPIGLPNAHAVGWLLVLIGAVLLIVVLVLDNCTGSHCLLAPAVLRPWRRLRL